MGGRGNADDIIAAAGEVMARPAWMPYYRDFTFPYFFYGPQEYEAWLAAAGLHGQRVELLVKDMVHAGPEELAGWIRTTWLGYVQRVPAELREEWIAEVIEVYLRDHPLDAEGHAHVRMVRLEVEAASLPAR
jgi:hypothetical protein